MPPNSIFAKLLGQGDYLEYPAADGAAIEPGMGLERVEANGETVVQPVSSADAESTLIAREQRNPPTVGDAAGSPVDFAYEGGDNVECRGFQQHEEARLRVAAGANVAKHDELGWDAGGALVTGGTNPQYEALEALDNSGGDGTALVVVKQLE